MSVTHKRTLRRLSEVAPIEERPCCPYCGNKLRPKVDRVQVEAVAGTPPPPPARADLVSHDANGIHLNDLSTLDDYDPSRVYRASNFLGHWSYDYWTGEYQGYHAMFCTYWCGVNFGFAAFKAGYRMERTCPHTGRG